MPITNEDIIYTLSGGETNAKPSSSLGGERSFFSVVGTSIFSDIQQTDVTVGYTDYKCIYVNNYNTVSTLFETKVYLTNQVSGGSLLLIGFEFLNERQDLKITKYDTITSGTFDINYQYLVGGDMIVLASFTINYDSNFTTMANEIQTSLRSVVNLEDVTVSVSNDASVKEVAFQIEFVGSAGYRYHDLMTVTNVSIYGLSGAIAITRTVAGSPINRIADEIENNLVNPIGITFVNHTGFYPALIGDLRPLDFFAVWIKRICPAGVEPIEADGGIIRVSGGIV